MLHNTRTLCCVFLLLSPLPAVAADWPQFLGPNRDAAVKDNGRNLDWKTKTLATLEGAGRQRLRRVPRQPTSHSRLVQDPFALTSCKREPAAHGRVRRWTLGDGSLALRYQ